MECAAMQSVRAGGLADAVQSHRDWLSRRLAHAERKLRLAEHLEGNERDVLTAQAVAELRDIASSSSRSTSKGAGTR